MTLTFEAEMRVICQMHHQDIFVMCQIVFIYVTISFLKKTSAAHYRGTIGVAVLESK